MRQYLGTRKPGADIIPPNTELIGYDEVKTLIDHIYETGTAAGFTILMIARSRATRTKDLIEIYVSNGSGKNPVYCRKLGVCKASIRDMAGLVNIVGRNARAFDYPRNGVSKITYYHKRNKT
jgi:hypothetical protein